MIALAAYRDATPASGIARWTNMDLWPDYNTRIVSLRRRSAGPGRRHHRLFRPAEETLPQPATPWLMHRCRVCAWLTSSSANAACRACCSGRWSAASWHQRHCRAAPLDAHQGRRSHWHCAQRLLWLGVVLLSVIQKPHPVANRRD